MHSLAQDLRYAARMLSRNPGFTAVALLVIALGIGANSAIFTIINAYMLRPLPFPNADRLALIDGIRVPRKRMTTSPTAGEFATLQRNSRPFEQVVAARYVTFNVTGGEQAEMIRAMEVSAGLFRLLGVAPQYGRDFTREEDMPGGPRAAVLSFGLWQRRFAGRGDVLGSAIELNGNKYSVVGIMSAGFRFPEPRCQLWTTLQLPSSGREQPGIVFGRLRAGISLDAAAAELKSLFSGSERFVGENIGVEIFPLYDWLNHRQQARAPLLVLLAAVGFVLLIACANVGNLLLGRAVARTKEIAIRTTMGASRWRIVRQALTESLMLSGLGGAVGLFLGIAGAKLLMATAPAYMFPLGGMDADARVLLLTAAASVLAGILFGLAPALQISRARLNDALKEGGRSATGGRSRTWMRNALVVAEIAPALVLLIGAGLLMKSFVNMQTVDLGFRPEGVLTTELTLPPAKYPQPAQRVNFLDQALPRIARIPGVIAAGTSSRLGLRSIVIEGQPAPAPGHEIYAVYRPVSPDYFRAMGVPLRAGRFLDDRDTATAQRVVVINQTMAKRYWPSQNPVGRMVRVNTPDAAGWMTIAGVVGDSSVNVFGTMPPEMYVPYAQEPPIGATLVLRVAGDTAAIARALRAEFRAIDKDQPLADLQMMDEVLAANIAPQRLTTQMLGGFAAVAFVLAVLGLYGVISYTVTQRTHELGIRMALGAGRSNVLRLVVGQGAATAAIGIAIGAATAFGVTRLMSVLLFGVKPTDPAIFITAPLALGAVAVIAAYVPARRAAAVDPVVALRNE